MSTKKEEKAAFEKLKKAFPGKDCSLSLDYNSWREHPYYYATVHDVGSSIGEGAKTANEGVELMIKKEDK
jgi:hypothetical protein